MFFFFVRSIVEVYQNIAYKASNIEWHSDRFLELGAVKRIKQYDIRYDTKVLASKFCDTNIPINKYKNLPCDLKFYAAKATLMNKFIAVVKDIYNVIISILCGFYTFLLSLLINISVV